MEPENVVAVPTIPVVVLGTVAEVVQLDRHVMELDNVVAVPTIPVVPAMPVAQQTERPRPPLNMLDVENAVKYQDSRRERLPTGSNLLGPFTVMCLLLNRTIGSGIFVVPALVAGGTGSAGGSLLVWAFGGLISTCGLMVWLQLGLSLPLQRTEHDRQLHAVPRSGGEKNYVEIIYRGEEDAQPKRLVSCMYGISFVVLGNLSGNAIAFGIYLMNAAGYSHPTKGPVLSLAIGALSLTVLLHMVSRRAGILLNNIFAMVKVALLLAIIVLGFLKAGGITLGGEPKATDNFATATSFKPGASEVPSVSNSLLYVVYTYSGFEQPFYVLAEIAKPRKVFPTYTLMAMAIVITLFVLVNVAYLCAVPWDLPALHEQRNMATVFFGLVFGNETATRVMDSMIALSIFGNLLVMTFTAPRVKQEIAKEGILPWSLEFATSHRTLMARMFPQRHRVDRENRDATLEQSPMAALVLHWFTSILLIALTAMLDLSIAYSVLVTMYSYVIIILNGFFTSFGLLYLKFSNSSRWREPNFHPKGGAVYAAVYFVACGFLLFAAFAQPSDGSPYSYAATHITWFLLPLIGLSAPMWGIAWYLGLRLMEIMRGRRLTVIRDPMTMPDKDVAGQYIMTAEDITHKWEVMTVPPENMRRRPRPV